MTVPQFLTVKDVAERLQVCEKTVRRLIDAGELPVYRIKRAPFGSVKKTSFGSSN